MDLFLQYVFTRVDTVKQVISFFTICLPVFYLFLQLVISIHNSEFCQGPEKRIKSFQHIKKVSCLWFMLVFSHIAIPTQKDIMLIVGGKLAIDVVQSPEMKETSGKLYKLFQQKIDEQLANQPKKEESK